MVHEPPLGCTKDDLDTPALCVDLDVMEANIAAVAKSCREAGVAWRPHAKGHKNASIAHRQLAAGAIGVTCAKLGEAEAMARAGIRDLLIANQIVGSKKLARLSALRRVADPIVCVDHREQLEPLAAAMAGAGESARVLVEVDLGMNRAGVAPGNAVVELAQLVDRLPGVELAGVMGYEGHLLAVADQREKRARIGEALGMLVESANALRRAGLPCPIVSCGGTGSYTIATQQPGITEVQAGGAIFMDAFYRHECALAELNFALTVLTTVVGRPARERAIIDAGRKTLNIEVRKPLVVGRRGVEVDRLSAEHGQLHVSAEADELRIGARIELVPGYADLTVMLHDRLYGFRRGRLEAILPVESRGVVW
ncbi:MAG TPA: DSD1 family PLP-dependent enzyme [Pirellulales bacterium]|nr:DSD1 family PLP-dependent enzyme [Pirellulales bacterium]